MAFDAPSREECTAERGRSNTPLQALVLLNDPAYVEAARSLAERILLEGGDSTSERIDLAMRLALCRPARPDERSVLEPLLQKHLDQYRADPKAAEALLSVGQKPRATGLDAAELAAWTDLARVILNLHAVISRS